MPDEVAILRGNMQSPCTEHIGGVDFYSGTLCGKRAVLCCAGIGKVNAAAAAQLLITHFGADAVVFSGIAGNMSDEIGVGDMVLSSRAVYHDADNRMIAQTYPHTAEFCADERLLAAAKSACEACGVRYTVGTVATGDQFVGDSAVKANIAARCAPACVEMEGAAVAHIAAKNDTPFVILRAMSDNSDTAVEVLNAKVFDITEYCRTASDVCMRLLQSL